jgi:hypothetical protein
MVEGCDRIPGLFGACVEHQGIPIRKEFDAAVARGAAACEPPPCFDGHARWQEYVACWSLKERITSRYSKHIEFCRDCSPTYRSIMDKHKRCTHEEVIFVRKQTGEIVGVSAHFVSRWESALLGLHGEVVQMPSPEAVDRTTEKIARARAPKKMGRPRKER